MAKLYFSYSAMNAGKSTVLLQASHNYGERGMQTMLFTAKLDNRSSVGNITSRIGLSEKALTFENKDNSKALEFFNSSKKRLRLTSNSCITYPFLSFTVSHISSLSSLVYPLI